MNDIKEKMPRIVVELDKPNRLLSTSSFFIHPSNFMTCLWFLAKNKKAAAKRGFRERGKPSNAGLAKA